MNKRLPMRVSGFLIGIFIIVIATNVSASQETLRFGSVAMDVPTVMHKRLTPLTRYLSDELKQPVTLKLSKNMSGAIKDVSTGSVELAYLTPVAYIKSNKMGQTRLIAKTITKGRGSFKLMIVVKEDSPIKTIDDLKGRSFAFGDKAALLQRAVVVGAGVDLDALDNYQFLGHYDNIVRAVLHGDYDAGILKDTMAFKWQGKGIRVLHASAELPPYNIAASKNISDELLEKLKKAFLSLDPNNDKHREIIKALDKKYDGFAATSDAEYDVVRKLVAPFSK
ncbi:MAG: PhnD/SsuA/transferrin family substrate-binding protein [Thioalkalispiraceae bacterium]|jgi:phosphonate transport system substrate-binding protein